MAIATLGWKDGVLEFPAPDDESGFWRVVAKKVFELVECPDVGEVPTLVSVSSEYDVMCFAITARGTFDDGSGERPSPFVVYDEPDMDYRTFCSCRSSADYDDPWEAYRRLCLVGGELRFETRGEYREAYLAYASPHTKGGRGSYKFYRLVPEDGRLKAQYGRIGTAESERGFGVGARWAKAVPSWLYWLRYEEKLAKGYVDLTTAYLTGDEQDMLHVGITPKQVEWLAEAGITNLVALCGLDEEGLCAVRNIGPAKAASIAAKLRSHGMSLEEPGREEEAAKADPVSAELYEILFALAKGLVNEELVAGATNVTAAMVRASRELLLSISEATTVEQVNRLLLSLMLVCPRRADNVSRFLVNSMADVKRVIDREEDLVLAMEACVTGSLKKERRRKPTASMADFGIEVSVATPEEVEEVLSLMHDPYTGRAHPDADADRLRVWRVEPAEQRRRFASYCESRGITDIRRFWHGSSSANWASIVTTGLQIRPTAAHGSMFGRGIYTANSFQKSLGYCNGGYWAGGSGTRLLGVYDTAYGHPMSVQAPDYFLDRDKVNGRGFDCVHAYRGDANLRNDEIVFYDDDAVCLRYLVQVM